MSVQAAQDERPLKIGVLADMNSNYADQTGAGAAAAVRMACADFGPVFGRPVEVVFADSQLRADVASTTARRCGTWRAWTQSPTSAAARWRSR